MGSINAFFRKSSISRIKSLFDHNGIELGDGIDWTAETPLETKKLIKAVGAQGDAVKNLLAPIIERIEELTTPAGQVAIRSVIDEDDAFFTIASPHDRAIHLFVEAHDKFLRAEHTLFSEERRRRPRSYDGFIIDRGIDVRRDAESVETFRDAIKKLLSASKVYVDIFDRQRIGYDDKRFRIVQVSVFHEGIGDDVLEFVNADDIGHSVRNPVFEAALIYEPETGVLEVMANNQEDLVDVIVVYKIDRLSRSLMDFAKLVEIFDRHNVTFVSVTQSFNTTTSMGRLTLNILLSFAQFEREVIGERIRDKFAASRKRGMWMGGYVPLGYDVRDRKLVVNATEAALVREIFTRFVELGSATILAKEFSGRGVRNKRGALIDKGFLYRVLNNRVYLGEACHKGASYPGEHAAIIGQDLWDKAHAILGESPRTRAANTRNTTPALLKGLIFMESGVAMTPTAAKKGAKLYRYYTSMDLIKNRVASAPTGPQRLAAGMVEGVVVTEMRRMLRTPEVAARAIEALREAGVEPDERAVVAALAGFDDLWASLFPAEQGRIVQLVVQRVTVSGEGISVDLRNHGVGSVVREMLTPPGGQ